MANVVMTPPVLNPADPCANHQAMVNNYTLAEYQILQGQTVQWGDRRLTRVNLEEIIRGRKEWEQKLASCKACQQGAGRARFGGLRTTLADIRPTDLQSDEDL